MQLSNRNVYSIKRMQRGSHRSNTENANASTVFVYSKSRMQLGSHGSNTENANACTVYSHRKIEQKTTVPYHFLPSLRVHTQTDLAHTHHALEMLHICHMTHHVSTTHGDRPIIVHEPTT